MVSLQFLDARVGMVKGAPPAGKMGSKRECAGKKTGNPFITPGDRRPKGSFETADTDKLLTPAQCWSVWVLVCC